MVLRVFTMVAGGSRRLPLASEGCRSGISTISLRVQNRCTASSASSASSARAWRRSVNGRAGVWRKLRGRSQGCNHIRGVSWIIYLIVLFGFARWSASESMRGSNLFATLLEWWPTLVEPVAVPRWSMSESKRGSSLLAVLVLCEP